MNTETLKPAAIKHAQLVSAPGLSARGSKIVKRIFDVFMAFLGLLLLWPLFLLIAILIKRESPGPVLYRGLRMGKRGKVFSILKFRSMYERPESYNGPRVTAKDDDRITPLGRWLRDTKLNELPQLWNVLIGDMSLVGPRPEDPAIVATWPEDAREEILSVRPGLSSQASISYHDEERRLSSDNLMGDYLDNILPDKLRLDRLYVRHRTFMADLDVLFWTLIILNPRLGEQRISEGWLFGGPFTRLIRGSINWFMIDFLSAMFSIGVVGILWRMSGPLELGQIYGIGVAILLATLFGLVNSILGLDRVDWSRAAADDVFGLFVSCGLVTIVGIVGYSFVPIYLRLPNGFLLVADMAVLFSFVIVRYRFRLLTGLATRWLNFRKDGYSMGERVLIVGAGQGGEFSSWLLNRPEFQRLFTVVGYADDHPAKQGMRFDGHYVLGTCADIPDLVQRKDVGILMYAINKISREDNERILETCRKTGARIIIVSDVLKTLQGQLSPGKHKAQSV
jgi:lipopolysaccharide/colanic/teichoic acid biosynthesis glycosyltransferase